jgi:hypothetical protein
MQEEPKKEQNSGQSNEREFYILTINQINTKTRQHSKSTVEEWINDLKSGVVPYYKIEYAIKGLENEVKNHFINDSLYCGIVTDLELRGDDLYGKAKFKTKMVPNPDMITNPNFFDDLTIVPKGKGNVRNNIIINYKLIGFNLVEKKKATFQPTSKTEKTTDDVM